MYQSKIKSRSIGFAALTAASALILSACAGGATTGGDSGPAPAAQEGVGPGFVVDYSQYGDAYEGTITVTDVPGTCSYEEISKKDYSGQTLRILSHVPPVLGEPAELLVLAHGGRAELANAKQSNPIWPSPERVGIRPLPSKRAVAVPTTWHSHSIG